jgi:predicted N-acyltransferase
MQQITLSCLSSLDGVNSAEWDALDHAPNPFLEWAFLRAAELTNSLGAEAGWEPHYLLLRAGEEDWAVEAGLEPGTLIGAVAAFCKSHSHGEYIFDFQWANASHEAGLPYYPKLVIAAPVTPATGPRILLHPSLDGEVRQAVAQALIAAVRELSTELGCRSIHWLFITDEESGWLREAGFIQRSSLQFHWHNRDYASFDEFLAQMTSRKRKKFRRERARVREQVDSIRWLEGDEIDGAALDAIQRFYTHTTDTHWGRAYLNRGFFHRLAELAPERLRLVLVERGADAIAGAMFMETPAALYGRYWGCSEEVDCLHFETAYYSGIERCIEKGIPLFEAGAQGEHKLLRGFEPALCRSAHEMQHPGLARAIRDFCRNEAMAVERQIEGLAAHGPYRRGEVQ